MAKNGQVQLRKVFPRGKSGAIVMDGRWGHMQIVGKSICLVPAKYFMSTKQLARIMIEKC